jgi:hypothetical protein
VKSPPDGTGILPPDELGNNDLRPVARIGSPCGGESARPHKPRPANCGRSDTPPARIAITSCWRLHRPTSVWTLLEAVNSVIGLTALYHIVRALRWDAVRGRGLTDLGRYRRSPRGPRWWRPNAAWGRCTSRGGVHARRTKRQLANCFRWLCLRTSFLTPRRPHRRPPTRCGGRGRPWAGEGRTFPTAPLTHRRYPSGWPDAGMPGVGAVAVEGSEYHAGRPRPGRRLCDG